MGIKDISWDLFTITGDIKLFLLYKKFDDIEAAEGADYFYLLKKGLTVPGEGLSYDESERSEQDDKGSYNKRN